MTSSEASSSEKLCPKCHRMVATGCNYCACPFPVATPGATFAGEDSDLSPESSRPRELLTSNTCKCPTCGHTYNGALEARSLQARTDVVRKALAEIERYFGLTPHAPETLPVVSFPMRVRLLKDIYDDGQDHHPPGYLGRKGDVVFIHSIQTAVVSHTGTGHGFIVHDGDLEMTERHSEKANATPVVRSNWQPSRVPDGWDCWTCGAFLAHKQSVAEVERDCLKCGPNAENGGPAHGD